MCVYFITRRGDISENVHDDHRKMKVKRWGGKMKNREEWRQIVQEAKAHPEL
jgi:hypothetical protein